MTTDVLSSLAGLERIINQMASDLMRYVHRENASELYVQKQNEIILELTNLFNKLSSMRYLELWTDIENRIEYLEKVDPELNAHTIVIHTKPSNNCNYSFIEFNPFKP